MIAPQQISPAEAAFLGSQPNPNSQIFAAEVYEYAKYLTETEAPPARFVQQLQGFLWTYGSKDVPLANTKDDTDFASSMLGFLICKARLLNTLPRKQRTHQLLYELSLIQEKFRFRLTRSRKGFHAELLQKTLHEEKVTQEIVGQPQQGGLLGFLRHRGQQR